MLCILLLLLFSRSVSFASVYDLTLDQSEVTSVIYQDRKFVDAIYGKRMVLGDLLKVDTSYQEVETFIDELETDYFVITSQLSSDQRFWGAYGQNGEQHFLSEQDEDNPLNTIVEPERFEEVLNRYNLGEVKEIKVLLLLPTHDFLVYIQSEKGDYFIPFLKRVIGDFENEHLYDVTEFIELEKERRSEGYSGIANPFVVTIGVVLLILLLLLARRRGWHN